MKKKTVNINKKSSGFVGPLIAALVLAVILSFATDTFLTIMNLMNVLRQTSINAIISLAMLVCLVTGGIDLSVGAIVGISCCSMAFLLNNGITSWPLMIIVALVAGLVSGLVNGLLFTVLKLPHPFVSTMGVMQVLRGVCLLLTNNKPVTGFSEEIMFLGYESIGQFPVCFIVVIIVVALFTIFLNKTALGRKIYSIGSNKEASRLAGINVNRVLTFVYVLSGFMSALAGIMLVGRVGSAYPLAGEGYEMDAVAACVIGGTSFSGGKGTAIGALIGALIIAIVKNGLNLLGAASAIQQIVVGIVIVVAVFIDVTREATAAKMRKMALSKIDE